MANFRSCDLCSQPLSGGFVDIQISPAVLVQLSENGDLVHRPRGLRNYHLCDRCGGFLRDVMRAMAARRRSSADSDAGKSRREGAA